MPNVGGPALLLEFPTPQFLDAGVLARVYLARDAGVLTGVAITRDAGVLASLYEAADAGVLVRVFQWVNLGTLAQIVVVRDAGVLTRVIEVRDTGVLARVIQAIDLGVLAPVVDAIELGALVIVSVRARSDTGVRVGITAPTLSGAGSGWYGLLTTYKFQQEETRMERQGAPILCPYDTSILMEGPGGVKQCPWCDYQWPRDGGVGPFPTPGTLF